MHGHRDGAHQPRSVELTEIPPAPDAPSIRRPRGRDILHFTNGPTPGAFRRPSDLPSCFPPGGVMTFLRSRSGFIGAAALLVVGACSGSTPPHPTGITGGGAGNAATGSPGTAGTASGAAGDTSGAAGNVGQGQADSTGASGSGNAGTTRVPRARPPARRAARARPAAPRAHGRRRRRHHEHRRWRSAGAATDQRHARPRVLGELHGPGDVRQQEQTHPGQARPPARRHLHGHGRGRLPSRSSICTASTSSRPRRTPASTAARCRGCTPPR